MDICLNGHLGANALKSVEKLEQNQEQENALNQNMEDSRVQSTRLSKRKNAFQETVMVSS